MTLSKRNSFLPVVYSEYPFLKSCVAVKQMGIDVRDIRKLLVSNLMPCMQKRVSIALYIMHVCLFTLLSRSTELNTLKQKQYNS